MNSEQNPVENDSSSKGRTSVWLKILKPKVGITIAVLVLTASLPIAYRGWRLSLVPPVDAPFDVGAFQAETIPNAKNALIDYEEACKRFNRFTGTREESSRYNYLSSSGWTEVPSGFDEWISLNNDTIEIWERGTKKPSAYAPPGDVTKHYPGFYNAAAREIARLVTLKAALELNDGRSDLALSRLLSIHRFSRHLQQAGPLRLELIGSSIQALFCDGLVRWAHHPNTNSQNLQHAIQRLNANCRELPYTISQTLKHFYFEAVKDLNNAEDFKFWHDTEFVDGLARFVCGEPEYSKLVFTHLVIN